MEETKPKLNLLELTTFVYAFFIFLGYSYIDAYFRNWGIHIYPFLDASEILLSFLNNFNAFLITVLLFCLIISFPFILPDFLLEPKPNLSLKLDEKYPFLKKPVPPIFIFGSFALLLGFLVYDFISTFTIIKLLNLIILLLIVLFIFFNYKVDIIIKKYRLTFNKYIIQVVLLIVFSFSLINLSALYQFRKVKDSLSITSFSFNYESTKYNTSDSLLYIGATSKYIFLRNTKSETNLIFEKSNIKNLSLIEKSNKPK
jgi:hypothetical protein